jgi:hypothetical protein
MMKRFFVFAVCVLMALPCSVMGMPDAPQVELVWTGAGGGSWASSYTPNDVTPNGDGSYILYGGHSNGCLEADWSINFKPDPYVSAGVNVKNTTSAIQTFTFIVTSPVSPPITPTSLHGGDMAGSFTTDPLGGTISTVSPDPLYYGLIDGSGVLQLHPDPSSWTRVSGGTTPIPYTGAGLPASLPSGPVMTDIGIQFKFDLTPDDIAVLSGYFEVVPEPGTICLLGLGTFLGLLRKRRL